MPRGNPKKRPKPKAFGPLPERMSDAKEIALGLWLLKSLRCHAQMERLGKGTGLPSPTAASMDAADRVIELAGKVGVKDEFFELLFELELWRVELKPLET